ncbi:MAG: hypothetical protein Kow0032_03190 [Methyloligellaceae bacterium]
MVCLLLLALACLVALPFAGAKASAEPPAGETREEGKARPEGNLVGHGGPVKAVQINPDQTRILTGSFDYSMIHWDISGPAPKILHRYEEHDGAVNAVRFVPGSSRALSAGDDGMLRLWDLKSGALLHKFTGHKAKVVDIAVSPDGRLAATASWDRTVRLWDLHSMTPGPVLKGHSGPVNAVAFTRRDGKPLGLYSASYDGTIRAWDMATGDLVRTVYRHGWGINGLKALADPRKLLFGSLNGAAGIIDIEAGEISTVLNPHEGPVLALAVSQDESLIATAGGDGRVNVWNTADWSLKEQHHNPYGPVWGMAFAAGGKKIYYASLDDFVTLWQVTPRRPFEQVSSRFPRRFQVREDMSLGERQFAGKCSVCHTITPDGGNRAGPTLFGVFGRKAGTVPGYAYSKALRKSGIIWNEDTIGQLFDYGPQHVTPGSKMPLQQIEDTEKRNALIAYLKAVTDGRKNENDTGSGAGTSN